MSIKPNLEKLFELVDSYNKQIQGNIKEKDKDKKKSIEFSIDENKIFKDCILIKTEYSNNDNFIYCIKIYNHNKKLLYKQEVKINKTDDIQKLIKSHSNYLKNEFLIIKMNKLLENIEMLKIKQNNHGVTEELLLEKKILEEEYEKLSIIISTKYKDLNLLKDLKTKIDIKYAEDLSRDIIEKQFIEYYLNEIYIDMLKYKDYKKYLLQAKKFFEKLNIIEDNNKKISEVYPTIVYLTSPFTGNNDSIEAEYTKDIEFDENGVYSGKIKAEKVEKKSKIIISTEELLEKLILALKIEKTEFNDFFSVNNYIYISESALPYDIGSHKLDSVNDSLRDQLFLNDYYSDWRKKISDKHINYEIVDNKFYINPIKINKHLLFSSLMHYQFFLMYPSIKNQFMLNDNGDLSKKSYSEIMNYIIENNIEKEEILDIDIEILKGYYAKFIQNTELYDIIKTCTEYKIVFFDGKKNDNQIEYRSNIYLKIIGYLFVNPSISRDLFQNMEGDSSDKSSYSIISTSINDDKDSFKIINTSNKSIEKKIEDKDEIKAYLSDFYKVINITEDDKDNALLNKMFNSKYATAENTKLLSTLIEKLSIKTKQTQSYLFTLVDANNDLQFHWLSYILDRDIIRYNINTKNRYMISSDEQKKIIDSTDDLAYIKQGKELLKKSILDLKDKIKKSPIIIAFYDNKHYYVEVEIKEESSTDKPIAQVDKEAVQLDLEGGGYCEDNQRLWENKDYWIKKYKIGNNTHNVAIQIIEDSLDDLITFIPEGFYKKQKIYHNNKLWREYNKHISDDIKQINLKKYTPKDFYNNNNVHIVKYYVDSINNKVYNNKTDNNNIGNLVNLGNNIYKIIFN